MNCMYGPLVPPDPHVNQQEHLNKHVKIIFDILQQINDKRKFSNEFIKMAIFEMVVQKLVSKRIYGNKVSVDNIQTILDYRVELVNRVALQIPGLNVKNLQRGFCMKRSCLLIPILPDPQSPKHDQIEAMGFKLNNQKREPYRDTTNTLEKLCITYFGSMLN